MPYSRFGVQIQTSDAEVENRRPVTARCLGGWPHACALSDPGETPPREPQGERNTRVCGNCLASNRTGHTLAYFQGAERERPEQAPMLGRRRSYQHQFSRMPALAMTS